MEKQENFSNGKNNYRKNEPTKNIGNPAQDVKNYIFLELVQDWEKFSSSKKFDLNFDRRLKIAVLIMKVLNNSTPMDELVDELLLICSDFPLFCEVTEQIVLLFSPRGVELMKFLCPNWQNVPTLCGKISQVEERNKSFDKMENFSNKQFS